MITFSAAASDDVWMRPLADGDAGALSRAQIRNREHTRATAPYRDESYYTVAGQAERIGRQLTDAEAGRTAPWVLARGDEIVGAVTLSEVTLGPLRSASIGYWVDAAFLGRGLATAAATLACRAADEELGLHRVQASTLLDNVASQRVLAKVGFEEYGIAPRYLHIDGEWRDNRLFQKILNDRFPGAPAS